MIKPNAFGRVRAVEDRDGEGTVVTTDFLKAGKDTIFPLQAALGVETSQTLAVKQDNLVLEGASDLLYMNIMSEHLKRLGRTGLDPRWTLVPAGGLTNIPTFLSLFGAQLNVATVFDVQTGGQQRITQMVERGIVAANKLIPITSVTGTKQGDMEDLFDPEFYLELVRGSGEAPLVATDLGRGDRIVTRIEMALGREFDHYGPAFFLLRSQGSLLDRIDAATLDRFEALFQRANAALS
jgi:hypothetical protein